jgi:tetratricopeptide (TPR) repeat protein
MPQTDENKREQIDVLLSTWSPMIALSYPEGSLQILENGAGFAEELGDKKSLAMFHASLGNYYVSKGDPIPGIKYNENSFEEAKKVKDDDLIIPIGTELVVSYYWTGAFLKVVEVSRKLIELLEKTHRESDFFRRPYPPYMELHCLCGSSLASLGKFNEGEIFCEKGLLFAQRIDNLFALAFAEVQYGILFLVKGDGGNAIEHLKNSLKLLEKAEVQVFLPGVLVGLGMGYQLLGKLEMAHSHIKRGLTIQKDMGIAMGLSLSYLSMSGVHLELDEIESAQKCAEIALDFAQKGSEKHIEAWVLIILGRVLGKKESPHMNKAEECILQGIKISNGLKTRPIMSLGYLFLAELYAATGRRLKALTTLKRAQRMFKAMGMDYYLALSKQAPQE